MFENQKKRKKYGNKDILPKSPSLRLFRYKIYSLLRRADA